MMTVEEALDLTRRHYPNGPEMLAEQLGVQIEYEVLSCDGWCIVGPVATIIRINSDAPRVRQRFTLAHELSHFLLGIPSDIGESINDSIRESDEEERRVNDLAARILVPESILIRECSDIPVGANRLRKLAVDAKVSVLSVAMRIAKSTELLGLDGASVISYLTGDTVRPTFSSKLTIDSTLAEILLEGSRKMAPLPFRYLFTDKNQLLAAALVENPMYASTLLIQRLPTAVGNRQTSDERLAVLRKYLFDSQPRFQSQLEGCFGSFKSRATVLTIAQAIEAFFSLYSNKWSDEAGRRFHSDEGREYVELRLKNWCR